VVDEKNDQEIIIEFASWRHCHFLLRDRDDFIASVADVMGMEKGSTFSVRLESFHSHTFPEQQNALYQVSTQSQLNLMLVVKCYGHSRGSSFTSTTQIVKPKLVYELFIELWCFGEGLRVIHAWISFGHSVCAPQLMLGFLFQIECETFYVNRFIAAYNSTREAWALHMQLKEYAANILVRTVNLNFTFCSFM